MQFEQGPYIQTAGFCEQVIEDKSGVLSLIRMIDTVTTTAAGPDAPKEMPPVTYKLKMVIVLKSGRARGRHELKVIPELPSAETLPPVALSIEFRGEDQGARIIADMPFTFKLEGLYWFKVYLDDDLLTMMPFRVVYRRLTTGQVGTGRQT